MLHPDVNRIEYDWADRENKMILRETPRGLTAVNAAHAGMIPVGSLH